MNKVDVVTAGSYTRTDRDSGLGAAAHRPRTVRASYCREPYVRVKLDGTTLDAKAISWGRTSVQLKWIDAQGFSRTAWVPAGTVRRIHRDESSWRDPYDDYAFYYPGR
ncbi:MAG: hypothetical protein ACQEXN_08590 [Actinomycetota bacterium]